MPNFNGLRVLSLESCRATELASLITTFGGRPLVAPALREVPLESNTALFEFAAALIGLGQQQSGHVGANRQQQESHASQQQPERT